MDSSINVIPSITRIKQHYSLMSAQEKKIADYVMQSPQSLINMSAAEIAKYSGTGTATVVRFCRSIGFSGVAEFRNYLRREMGTWVSYDSGDSITDIAIKTIDYNKRAIDETLTVLNADAVEEAVEAIDRAERVVIFSEGGSGCSARCAYDSFLQIGLNCSLVMDPFFQMLEAAKLTAKDVALGLCHSGRARGSADSMRIARESGATTISIVGIVGSQMTKYSDILLYTGLADNSFHSEAIAVRICEMNVLSILHTALALRRSERLGDYRAANSKLLELKRYKK